MKKSQFSAKLAYGAADIYGGGSFLIISILYLVFLTDVVGLNPALAGSIPMIGKIWDALTDPIMGNIVDRTQSKYGAKRFYLLIGSFAGAITFAMMWITISGSANTLYFFYLLMYILFSTGFTIVMVPYNALLPDMVSDYTQRSAFTMYRMIFSALSAILAGLIPNMIVNRVGATQAQGFLIMGITFGVIFFLAILFTFAKTWETIQPVVKTPFKESFRESFSVFRNRSFRLYLGVFLFGQGSSDFITTLIIYFLAVVLRQPEQYTFIMSGVLVSQLLAMFFYQLVLKKTSKKFPIYLGFPIRMIATFSMIFFAYAQAPILPIFIASFISGLGTAASSVTSYAILTDLTDVDYLITTKRRAGIYSGMATFNRKIANGLAIWLIGLLLAFFKYDAGATVPSAVTVDGIKFMFIALPLLFMVATLYFTYKFPITKASYECIQKEIRRRLGELDEKATEEEIKICESVTGVSYDRLWKAENAR
ncbi:MAG: MFS transporter [Erysipelotrichaceae bacterium]|nr:MFS transporter [Erysipelotrichaceae bacterium]MDP3305865.1 MFS transporter [Erysipelotrichaceae bacterium]